MEKHLKKRPKKVPLPQAEQDALREKAAKKIQEELLPDEHIFKIILIGSSVKGAFGIYEPPGFRGSIYSDFDFIVFVEDDYEIPQWLKRELDGRPFPDEHHNLAYRQMKWLDGTYDAEIFLIRRSTWESLPLQELGEAAGIPMTDESQHSQQVIYARQ